MGSQGRRRQEFSPLALRLPFFLLRSHIQGLVNHGRNRSNLCSQLLFYLVQVEAIVIRNQVDGETQVSKATGSTNAMEIGFRILK